MTALQAPAKDRSWKFPDDVDAGVQSTVVRLLEGWDRPELRGPVAISRLSGGASNVNLKLEAPAASYALRVCAPDAFRWGVDRAAAIQAQQLAAGLGLAPQIVQTHLPDGHYLADFVSGTTVTSSFVREASLLPLIASTLKGLKNVSGCTHEFSPFDDLRVFLELGDAEGAVPPDDVERIYAAVLRVEALFRTRQPRRAFCHSDLVPQNFILHDGGLKLVDFDYAGNGWVAFELASFVCQAELDEDETDTFLRCYDPNLDNAQRARVELMRMVAGVREATWALMAEPLLSAKTAPLEGWTYRGYAEANLAQARLVIDSGKFAEYMKEARDVRPDALF